jgi:valyl-tRNA synthetase
MAALAAQGRGIKMSKKRVEGYRNFATKLWNAARFAEMNGCVPKKGFKPEKAKAPVNRWIAAETQRVAGAVTEAIEGYKFNEAAGALYQFVWHIYCDWYLELVKPALLGSDEALKAETQGMTAWVMDQILILLHPVMPYITEELWQKLAEAGGVKREALLVLTAWPQLRGLEDAEAAAELSWVLKANSEIRSALADFDLPPGTKLEAHLIPSGNAAKARVEAWRGAIGKLAGLKEVKIAKSVPKGAVQILLDGAVAAVPLAGLVDLAAEAKRIERRIAATRGEIEKLDAKLSNEQFISRAPAEVVEENRERRAEAEAMTARLAEVLKRIEAAV